MLRIRALAILCLLALGLGLGVGFSQPAHAEQSWGALAAAMTGEEIAVGSATSFATKEEAEAGALKACRDNGVPGCKVVDTFSGCGYITTGINNSARRVGWASGSTPGEATSACRERGLVCNHEPKGGCNQSVGDSGGNSPRVALADPKAIDISGKYSIEGTNPNGSTYGGTVTITGSGPVYNFRWLINSGDVFRGSGRLSGNTISVDWGQKYPVIYQVGGDGTLRGTWANGRASEDLVPDK
jgi:hypothetical protein